MGVVIVTPVKNRLGQMLKKPGGIKRQEAVEAAGKNVETLREEYVAAIPGEIAALEDMYAVSSLTGRISFEILDAMLRRAGQLLTLSGTFGFDRLDQVVKRFCDLVTGMVDKKIDDPAAVGVHLRAMRLFCPGAVELPAEEADLMLKGLVRVHEFYGIVRLAVEDDQPPIPPAG